MSLSSEPVVLASASRTRAAMLEGAGLTVLRDPAAVDEEEVKRSCRAGGLSAAEVAEALAELKARRVTGRHPGRLVLGADQMLDDGEGWLDKPRDREDARSHLRRLRGRAHRLETSVVAMRDGERVWHANERATLTMRACSDRFIDRYLDAIGDEALASVGAYQLEGLGAQLFSRVEGDYFVILGLPLLPVLDFLRAWGIVPT